MPARQKPFAPLSGTRCYILHRQELKFGKISNQTEGKMENPTKKQKAKIKALLETPKKNLAV
jgi:hypothetical protein